MPSQKKILLFSTLNPYPFWAGSENFWYDFVKDSRVKEAFSFHICLADSPVTRKKAATIENEAVIVEFYKHFNVSFTRRNLYRISDKVSGRNNRTLPWYDVIKKDKYDLVWFSVAALADLEDLAYPIQLCKKQGIPYSLILQHGDEDFFLSSAQQIDIVAEVAMSAKRFIFIAERNRRSLERGIGQKLSNAVHLVNALPASTIATVKTTGLKKTPAATGTAKFFNLGRFSPKDKAQHLLLELFADHQWNERDWQLSFIGVSEFGEFYLQKLVAYYGLNSDRIITKRHTENVLEEIADNDVLLMPSLAEGTPFAMIESMACGRPALGTPIGGIPELIIDTKTGWLSRTVQVQDIAEKMEQVWQDRSRWHVMGQAAQQHIEENYNQDTIFARLLKLFMEDTQA